MEKVQPLSKEDRRLMISEKLAEKGLSQQDLATKIGRSLATVHNWIAGTTVPEVTFEEAIEIRESLDCSLEDLAQMFPGRSKRRAAIKQSLRQKTPEK